MAFRLRRSGDSIRNLVCGYCSSKRSEKLLVMLQAYVDDSVSAYSDKRLFLAGYINFADKWMEFSDAWDSALREKPAIEYFHMVEAQNRRDQFKGWGLLDVHLKVMTMARVVRAHDPWSFQCSVSTKSFKKSFGDQVPYGFRSPYLACFIAAIVSVAKYHSAIGVSVPVDFIFDEQDSIHRNAVAIYQGLKAMQRSEWRSLLGSTPVFRDDKDVTPLQAADMLAWHVRRETVDGNLMPRRDASSYLIADGKHIMTHINDEIVEEMANNISNLPGVDYLFSKRRWKEVIAMIEAGQIPL